MTTATRRPGSKYMSTYDYSQVDNWSMSKDEASRLLDEAAQAGVFTR